MNLKCSFCQVKKPISEFYKNKSNPRGYEYACNDCKKSRYPRKTAFKIHTSITGNYQFGKTLTRCQARVKAENIAIHPKDITCGNCLKSYQAGGGPVECGTSPELRRQDMAAEEWDKALKLTEGKVKVPADKFGQHEGCNYLSLDFCNKCGRFVELAKTEGKDNECPQHEGDTCARCCIQAIRSLKKGDKI